MRCVCVCVHVWREGEKEGGRREREGCERCVYICVYVCGREGEGGNKGVREREV